QAPDERSPASRYEMIESVSFAFLLALEALTPLQRAVLLLRDVFDYSTAETADTLFVAEPRVKVTLHRARRKMREYDGERERSTPERSEPIRRALEQFLLCLNNGDAQGLERLLAEDVISVSDGGGEVQAALKTIKGRDKVIRLIEGISRKLQFLPR